MKPLIILAHYIRTGNKSPQRSRETIEEYKKSLEPFDEQFRYKHFVLPVKDTESRIECIFHQ